MKNLSQFGRIREKASNGIRNSYNEKRRMKTAELKALSDLLNAYERWIEALRETIECGYSRNSLTKSAAYLAAKDKTCCIYELNK